MNKEWKILKRDGDRIKSVINLITNETFTVLEDANTPKGIRQIGAFTQEGGHIQVWIGKAWYCGLPLIKKL